MSTYPDFYLIGAMKSGTTTLYAQLSNHSKIYLSPNKEPGYFSRDERFERGEEWYIDLFKPARAEQIKAEASTCYSRWPFYDKVIERIYAVTPDAKFIYIMRDPVQRTYSHYKHRMSEFISDGKEIISFDEAINTDEEMMCASDYALQITKYLEIFKREQFYFTSLDLLIAQPEKITREIYSFLGLKEEHQIKPTTQVHKNKVGNKIGHRKSMATLNDLKNKPVIKVLKTVIPRSSREKSKAVALRILKLYFKFCKKDTELNNTSKLSDEQIKFLRHRFSESITQTERLTELDLSSWKNDVSIKNG